MSEATLHLGSYFQVRDVGPAPAPAKTSSLFALASSLATKSKQGGVSIKTTMLPALPQRPSAAAQSAAQPAPAASSYLHRPSSAALLHAVQHASAAGPSQGLHAAAREPVYAAATVPCYEPGFLTQPFRQAAASACN